MKKILLVSTSFITISIFTFNVFAYEDKGQSGFPYGVVESEKNEVFGSAYAYDHGNYDTIKVISEDNYNNSYIDIPKYHYVIFKYNQLLDAPIGYLGKHQAVSAGNKFSFEYTYSETKTLGYEESFKETNSTSTEVKLKAGVSAKMFEASSELSNSVVNSEERGLNFSQSYSVASGYKISVEAQVKDYDTYWWYVTRASFNVYKVVVYELTYNTIVETHKTWYGKKYHTYKYSQTGANLVDTAYRYSYVNGSIYEGLFEYERQNGIFELKSSKDSNYTYLD